jgi:hypothetical protein
MKFAPVETLDDWGESSPRVSFLALPRTHTLCHQRVFTNGSYRVVQRI